MKALFWIGLVLMILGVVSLLVPIPRNERDGVKVAGVSIGIETRHDEKAPPIVTAIMILGGAGLMIAGKTAGRTAA
jgi:nucleoside recognition membrane protein YjiH